ncbi:hypothetical protein QMK33_02240 [Hymenobacter sp. H14-R3]|uniref:hypothetical protein n=1 Tax=Hymenobacter sp. H14-R3 TaxID=3046308 RepID=UPI0024BB465C|nr:hypothetical protein [Hymenobacter sp. H14-R3]MDJ0363956.1 hypothetical protein [Hymenobacter sp. H14-R3]
MEKGKHPAWLADKVLNNRLDWAAATKTSMQELLETITLHDSCCYHICLKRGSWVIVIVLDAVWNKAFCHNSEDWPFLIIKFPKVFCSFQKFEEFEFESPILSEVEVVSLGGKDFADWMDFTKIAGFFPLTILQDIAAEGNLTRTELSTVCGGYLSLVHAPAIEVLLYAEQGSQLAINLSVQPE